MLGKSCTPEIITLPQRSVSSDAGIELTGLTRDGVFLIEKGKVTDPVVNSVGTKAPRRFCNGPRN